MVDAERCKSSQYRGPVSAQAAEQYIKQGVVFGQHTKEEARRLGGEEFQAGYPQAS